MIKVKELIEILKTMDQGSDIWIDQDTLIFEDSVGEIASAISATTGVYICGTE